MPIIENIFEFSGTFITEITCGVLKIILANDDINRLAWSSPNVLNKRSARSIPALIKFAITVGSSCIVIDPSFSSTLLHLFSRLSITVTSEPASISQVANFNHVSVAPAIIEYNKTSELFSCYGLNQIIFRSLNSVDL